MEFSRLISERRAVNFFDPAKSVSEEKLRQMVTLASLMPSSFNLQPWNLIVVWSASDKMRLRKQAMDQSKVTEAPVVLIVLADKEGYLAGHGVVEKVWEGNLKNGYMKPEQREWFSGACKGLYGGEENSLAFAVKNAAFFGAGLMLAAKELGLDSHPMDGFDREGIVKEFSIPPNYFVIMLLAVGYFDQSKRLLPRNWRKTYDEIVISSL